MEATIDIDRMIEICFAAQFFVYGYMALFLYPYNDYDTIPRMRHTGSKSYLRGRRVLAVVYIFLGIAARIRAMSGIPFQRECCGGLGIASRPGLSHLVLHGTYRAAVGVVRLYCHRS